MFELSVNLEYMFKEAGDRIQDRIAAAAAAGFRNVEIFSTIDRDLDSLRRSLDAHGVKLLTVVADPRTRLFDPSTHEDFKAIFRRAAEDALALGCTNVVCGSGPGVPFHKRAHQLATVVKAFEEGAKIAEELGVHILLEAVNIRVDHPGVLFSATEDTEFVAREVGSPHVGLLYDMYHSVVEKEDPFEVLPRIIDLVRHVQIADVPGRGEPGSGEVRWAAHLGLLKRVGYRGAVGVECYPTGETAQALAFIQKLATEV